LAAACPVLFRLAFIDVAAWIAPLVVVGLLAKPIGIADRFVPFVVASNWGSAIMAWMLLPVSIIEVHSSRRRPIIRRRSRWCCSSRSWCWRGG
jgi:hypothetical protein